MDGVYTLAAVLAAAVVAFLIGGGVGYSAGERAAKEATPSRDEALKAVRREIGEYVLSELGGTRGIAKAYAAAILESPPDEKAGDIWQAIWLNQ